MGECFSDLAHKSPELQAEFLYNAETQRNFTKNGQQLLAALNFFVSSINTIVNKTMEDSIMTVKQYEVSRYEVQLRSASHQIIHEFQGLNMMHTEVILTTTERLPKQK